MNKNSVYGDRSAMSPGGVRIGTPALTTRGFTETDFRAVADFLHRSVQIGLRMQAAAPSKRLDDFVKLFEGDEELATLRKDVNAFASRFAMPGWTKDEMAVTTL